MTQHELEGNRRRCARWRARHPERAKQKGREDYNRHHEARVKAHRERRKRDYLSLREKRLRNEFGLSLADYDKMHAEQGGVCAICHRPETRVIRGRLYPLVVDHNHRLNKVRALLCHACNVSIGQFEESAERCRAAVAYLEKHNGQ
jgi:Recombination endonuclease VII